MTDRVHLEVKNRSQAIAAYGKAGVDPVCEGLRIDVERVQRGRGVHYRLKAYKPNNEPVELPACLRKP